jgi:hypothetical protein
MQVKIKSKSKLFKTIIRDVDALLNDIPTMDHEGVTLEDSMMLDSFIDSIKNYKVKDEKGTFHYPFGTTIATVMVFDELSDKREEEKDESDRRR